MITDRLRQLQRHTNEFTALKRSHYLPETEIKEDDTSHSYSLALMAWQMNEMLDAGFDDGLILKYALPHDFVELYAGDVNAFAAPEARQQKKLDEQRAFERLSREYAHTPHFLAAIEGYQTHADETAWFVWGCDKIQALIQGNLDSWRCYYELHITDEQFRAKLAELRVDMPAVLLEFYDAFCQECIASYHYETLQDTLF